MYTVRYNPKRFGAGEQVLDPLRPEQRASVGIQETYTPVEDFANGAYTLRAVVMRDEAGRVFVHDAALVSGFKPSGGFAISLPVASRAITLHADARVENTASPQPAAVSEGA